MEHGNVELAVEHVFDLKAGGRGDILEIYAAVLRGDGLNHLDDALGIGLALVRAALTAAVERHGPRVDIAEGLEKNGLAFHDGNRRRRAEIAETENRRSVRDDRHEIGLRGAVV